MSSQLLFPGRGLPGNRSSVQAVHLAAKKTSRVSFWRSAVTTSCQKTRKLPTSAPAQRTPAQSRKLIVIVKLLQRVFMSRNKGKGLASRWVSPRRPRPGILRCPIAPVIFCSQLAVQRLQWRHWAAVASSGYRDDWAAAAGPGAAYTLDDAHFDNIIILV